MNTKILTGLRIVSFIAGIVGAASGFVVDRNDSRDLDKKLQEMRDIEDRIRNLSK